MKSSKALVIGNSDGIGLAVTRELLKRGWKVFGLSRSPSPIDHLSYIHSVMDVRDKEYPLRLRSILEAEESVELVIYFVGIGEPLDFSRMEKESEVIDVNFLGMIKTTSVVIPFMLKHGTGHFIGLSSLADELISPENPSYNASKAGISNYLEGMALALRSKGIYVTNVRFGFVDTKMARADSKPFMMSVDRAVDHLITCIEEKPVRYSAPWMMVPLVRALNWYMRLSL